MTQMSEKYWNSLCNMAEQYQKDGEKDGHWPPTYHCFSPSGVCIMVFKGNEDDCKTVEEFLHERPFE